MGKKILVILSAVFATLVQICYGCQLDNHSLWQVPIQTNILDIYEGIVISRGTTDIEGINSTTYGQATIAGPYFDISIEDSQLIVQTNSEFRNYEELEVALRVAITVDFNCISGGTRGGLLLWIDITDTNNNAPQFQPTNEYEFIITPPLPPGYSITGCINDVITVRDIDLTTQRINFTIDDNPYFEVFYDVDSSTTAKEFNAQLQTITFIRSLSEPLTLTITATDVDLTGNPALSTTALVRIVADLEFQFPEEPVFTQTFYIANYTDDHQINLLETISLRQGFDEYVNFTLEGEYVECFELDPNGNQLTLVVVDPLPDEALSETQIFLVVKAEREYTSGDSATIILQLPEEIGLRFERSFYEGSIVNSSLQLQPLVLSQGYAGVEVLAEIVGEYSNYFLTTVEQDVITLTMEGLPSTVIDNNIFITFEVLAGSNRSSASTIVNLNIIKDDNVTPVFDKSLYSGSYNPVTGLSVEQIEIVQGFDDTVTLDLVGENANLFQIVENGPIITISSTTIPPDMFSQQSILITIQATKPRTVGANAVVHITLPAARQLEFEESTYRGSIEGSVLSLQTILLIQGYEERVTFHISGEYSTYFTTTAAQGQVDIILSDPLPDIAITQNTVIILTLTASDINAITTSTTILLDVIKNDSTTPVFSQAIYNGTYSDAVIEIETINLAQGFDDSVSFRLDGDHAIYFDVANINGSAVITLQSLIPEDVIFNEKVLAFNVLADKAFTVVANAAVLIRFPTELTDLAVMRFSRNTYVGSLEGNETRIENIVLETGFENGTTEFILSGDYIEHFSLLATENVVQILSINTLPSDIMEATNIIVLDIEARRPRAVSVWTSIVLDIVTPEVIAPTFGQAYYVGYYTEETGLTFTNVMNLTEGYDETVTFALRGESSEWFDIEHDGNSVSLVLQFPIPMDILEDKSHLLFTILANKPNDVTGRAVISIGLAKDLQPGTDVTFDKVLYEGIIQDLVVSHETITVIGFSSSTVELLGEYSLQFVAILSNGEVTVSPIDDFALPDDVTHVSLELHAGTASAVLLLVKRIDVPPSPSVTFDLPSYAIRVGSSDTGLVGRLQATADNGEDVTYSLQLNNALLEERLTINGEGELYLSASLDSGFYTFEVVATTVSTQARGTATVHLFVESTNVCRDEHVMTPLIIFDIDEEEPHHDLLNGTYYDNCHFTLNNRWPLNHSWVYVDEGGLHTTAIDREHESIAFMPVSQVQVEVILVCESDTTRIKRSLTSDALGPYDYGSNKWILTDSILFNSRRSFVNIIVNDINDNVPIFVGKENEPLTIGYPVPELAEIVLPRALAELKATDADIGENAALLYWSSAEELSVSPNSGFVHLRNGAFLENGMTLTVNATDRTGQGLTGSIDIMVRLLDENYIAVVTVRDAFLDDELSVVSALSEAIGYEIKVLRAMVISNDVDTDVLRKKREVVTRAGGASLQLYVYGLIAREPVSVEQLTADISNIVTAPVSITSSVSLQDHLEGQEICVIVIRDTGLLVATIVLSVFLFIVLVLIAVWIFLRWRKNRNYDQFTDENSLASRNTSVDNLPKNEVTIKPRLEYEELKKSEKRLQEMLDAPIQEEFGEQASSKNDAVVNMPEPITAIVIQSIDKLKDAADDMSDDEFGEVKIPKRKSVVTFNENVEKIIHLEDISDTENISSDPDYEVYQL